MITLIFNPAMANNNTSPDIPPHNQEELKYDDAEYVKVLTKKLENLKAVDVSGLTKAERKEKRKEVRELKKELKAAGGGIYLSAGALIIIAILLILLL